MGATCCKKQQNGAKIYSTKALMNMKNFNSIDIYFSTQNLSRLEGQCLVVFTDRKLKLKKTNLAEIVNKRQTQKIRDQVYAHLENNNISFDKRYSVREKIELNPVNNSSDASTKEDKDLEHILINIDIPNIRFSKVMFILVEPWEGRGSIKKPLQKQIVKAMESIEQEGIKQVAFVQFDEEMGIPTNVGAAVLARSIFELSSRFKIVTICCRNVTDQLTYLSFFENFNAESTLTSYSRKSVQGSQYY